MKDIKGYEGEYAVTKDGQVWSYKRDKFLVPTPNLQGRLTVGLCQNGKQKRCLVHRLVAEAYIPNPDNLPQVNHKDENYQNNCVDNLEWCDAAYNCNYGTRNKRMGNKHKTKVRCIETGEVFTGMTDAAAAIGVHPSGISKCCRGETTTCGGYHWEYV